MLEIVKNFRLLEEGILIPKNVPDAFYNISYSKGGNTRCFNLEEHSFWFKHRNKCLVEVLKKFPPQGVLYDIGGGNGYVTLGLRNSGFDTILVEPGIEGARNARSRGLSPVICATLEDAGFKEKTIPAIGLFDVLEHIKDDSGFLRKIKSLLIDGGRLYLTVPVGKMLWSIEDNTSGHYRRYTLKEITRKIQFFGFEIDYTTYIFSILPLLIFLFRAIPSRIKLRQKSVLKQIQKEHNLNKGILSYLLDWYFKKELFKINTSRINFGSSCLIVARSKS